MGLIIIDGDVLCTDRMDGIHRFMIEILKRLDERIADENLEIHLIHRKRGTIKNLTLKNIKDVPLECRGKRYRMSVVPAYVKSTGGIYCSMSNDAVRCHNSIFTVMDLIPLSKLAHYPLKALLRMRLTYAAIKHYGSRIVTISNESKNDIVRKLGIEKERVTVVGTGYEHMNDIVADEGIFKKHPEIVSNEYYYAIGNQYPYKNFKWVKEVAARNPESTFVVAGAKTNIADGLDIDIKNMIYIGYVSDGENKALMAGAKAFIHPSKLEGFGLPPLEALSQGTPIIVANASCLPEIYGKTGHYIDPDNYDINIDELLEEKVEACDELLKKYSWDETAEQWLKIFFEASK